MSFLWAVVAGLVGWAWARDVSGALARRLDEVEQALAAAQRRIDTLSARLAQALRPGAQPRFETVARVCAALGVKLVAEPMRPAGH